MTAAELKASILDRAVRGELTAAWRTEREAKGEVERRETRDARGRETRDTPPSDVSRLTSSPAVSSLASRVSRPTPGPTPPPETAADLLAKIAAEKKSLLAAGKIKKSKPLPPITDDEKPFAIPETWAWVRLNDLFNFIDYRGKTPNKIDSGVPLVTAKNVRQGYMDYSVKDFISEKEFTERQSRGIAKKGDILFTTEAPLGFAAIADLERFSSGQRLIAFQQYTDNPLLDNKAFMYFLLAPEWQKYLYSKRTGTTVAGIKAEFLKELPIPLPPLAEQKAIVARVEELLKLVEEMKE